MLPKTYRLLPKNPKEKVGVLKGKYYSTPFFNLVVGQKRTVIGREAASQFLFVISNRVEKRAVWRNRAKRILREAVRQLLPQIRSGFEVTFFVRQALIGKGLKEAKPEMEKILQKASLIEE